MVKIVNIDVNIAEEVIFQQNKDIRLIKDAFKMRQTYTVTTDRRQYRNVIIDCDTVKAQKSISRNGAVVLNFKSHKVFEHVDVLQCNNCYRFGHVGRGCVVCIVYRSVCKACSGPHKGECMNLMLDTTGFMKYWMK